MEKNPIKTLIAALEECSASNVTVALVFRCSVNTLPEEQIRNLIAKVAEDQQITLEEAEERLQGAATSMSMTNASPDMGENALLSMIAEFSILQGNLSHDVLTVAEQRLKEKSKETSRIITLGAGG